MWNWGKSVFVVLVAGLFVPQAFATVWQDDFRHYKELAEKVIDLEVVNGIAGKCGRQNFDVSPSYYVDTIFEAIQKQAEPKYPRKAFEKFLFDRRKTLEHHLVLMPCKELEKDYKTHLELLKIRLEYFESIENLKVTNHERAEGLEWRSGWIEASYFADDGVSRLMRMGRRIPGVTCKISESGDQPEYRDYPLLMDDVIGEKVDPDGNYRFQNALVK